MHQSSDFEGDAVAVKFLQSWRDAGSAIQTKDKTGSGILNTLHVEVRSLTLES